MRRRFLLTGACLAIGIVSACSTPETVIKTEDIPTGGVRFINAVPDSSGAMGLDFRFIDMVESNAQFRMTFRNAPSSAAPFVSTLTEYKGARAGSRKFRVFLDDTIASITQTVLKDSSITVEALHNYTVMLWGNARSTGADKMKMTVWDETVPAPGSNVAFRIVNTQSTPINVRVYAQGGTAPAAATWANVPAYSASSYITLAPGSYMYNVRDVDDATKLFNDALALQGAAATVDIEALPGSLVAGSAISAFVFPRSTAGARTPQTAAFAVPAITFNWDKRPPRTCSPLC
ncbi:MAG: DUF4397 domain-containing protein [Gemmatimonadota bacterium]